MEIHIKLSVCSYTGAGITFSYTMRMYWWFSHTIAVFWSVWFPVHARKIHLTRYIKFIHILTIVIAITLSILPVGGLFGTGGYILSSHTVPEHLPPQESNRSNHPSNMHCYAYRNDL